MGSDRIPTIEVTSLGDLIEKVTPKRADPQSGRLRDYAIYRGMRNSRWELLTALDRLGWPETPLHAKAHLEEHLLRNFMRYSRPYLDMQPSSDLELLVIAQHHDLPTRLLDWTTSPLVATHFATIKGKPEEDRAIWKLDWRRLHEHFGFPLLALTSADLVHVLGEAGFNSLWELFGKNSCPDRVFVCMLEPPALDSRIVAQSAAFTLSSDKTRPLADILEAEGLIEALTKFVIPADRVPLVRDQLDFCSVDDRRLFPDLDGVAHDIARYYAATAEAEGSPAKTDEE